jgi:hypothetical protein
VIEFERGWPVIVDRSLYRELVKQAIARIVTEGPATCPGTMFVERWCLQQNGSQLAIHLRHPVRAEEGRRRGARDAHAKTTAGQLESGVDV